jgi:hypothetical protein
MAMRRLVCDLCGEYVYYQDGNPLVMTLVAPT